jgi:hypothetical protein
MLEYLALSGGFEIWHNVLLAVIVLKRLEVNRYYLDVTTISRHERDLSIQEFHVVTRLSCFSLADPA